MARAAPRPQHLDDLVAAKGKQMKDALGKTRFRDVICNCSPRLACKIQKCVCESVRFGAVKDEACAIGDNGSWQAPDTSLIPAYTAMLGSWVAPNGSVRTEPPQKGGSAREL